MQRIVFGSLAVVFMLAQAITLSQAQNDVATIVSAEEIQKVVNVEPLRLNFTHDDKVLNEKFQRYVNRMVENASLEARDGRKFEY